MRDSQKWTRREMLLAAVIPWTARGVASESHRVSEAHHRIVPTHTDVHMGPAVPYTEEAVAHALARPVTSLHGFDPPWFLTAFDEGEVSRLPDGRTLREYRIVAQDRELEVAPGIFFPAWTYNGSVPGPTLRCTLGDRVKIYFSNESVAEHTLHFHGIHAADMDGVVEVVRPGGSYVYEFDAEPYGLHLYHCHVLPVGLHMNRGLYGAFIVDPPQPRPPAREMVLFSAGWDLDFDGRNEIYTLNGAANFFRDHPIPIRRGELVRIYFVNALEFEPISSLHVHGNFFTVYRRHPTGERQEYTDIVTLCQADRCIVELSYRFPGNFMFHPHQSAFAERGAMGHFLVL